MADKTFNQVKLNVKFTQASNPSGQTHAGNLDPSATNGEDLAISMGKIMNWYANWHSVVWTGAAASAEGLSKTSGSYTITASLPTPTANNTLTFPQASGTILSTGNMSVTQVQSSSGATKIATITINGVDTDIYSPDAPVGADDNVVQKLNSDNKKFPVIFSHWETSNATATPATDTVNRNNSIFVNPSTGTLQSTLFAITSGSYAHILKAGTTALSSANAEHVFPNTGGTVLNTGTTSVTQVVSTGTKIATIKINGVDTDIYASDTDTTYSFGTVASGTQPYIAVKSPANTGTATNYKVEGLGSMATENTANWVPLKPDGAVDLYDSTTKIINSKYLPSYVDDVIEGYYKPYDETFTQTSNATFTVTSSQPIDWTTKYTNYFTRTGSSPNYVYTHVTGTSAPTWAASTYYALTGTTETGETGKIYVDLGTDPAEPYRWSGTTYVSMKSPTITAVANVVSTTNNGEITVSYTDGSTASTFYVYTHPALNHIPINGSSGQFVKWSSSGTGTWASLAGTDVPAFTGATSSAAGSQGSVPAPAQSTYNANGNRHYLRSDGSWSDDPVTTYDTLTLNVVAGS